MCRPLADNHEGHGRVGRNDKVVDLPALLLLLIVEIRTKDLLPDTPAERTATPRVSIRRLGRRQYAPGRRTRNDSATAAMRFIFGRATAQPATAVAVALSGMALAAWPSNAEPRGGRHGGE